MFYFPQFQSLDAKRYLLRLVLSVVALAALGVDTLEAARNVGSRSVGCDEEGVKAAKAEFVHLRNLRRSNLDAVSKDEFRAASSAYITLAEACYQELYGDFSTGDEIIDEGGMYMTPYGATADPAAVSYAVNGPSGPRYHSLFGLKWGADSPHTAGDDIVGPRSPGGNVFYSFMDDGVDASPEDAGLTTNTAIASLTTFESCFYEEITAAFAAWSAVSDINFLPSTDFGEDYNAIGFSGDIRIGAHEFDGASGVLAHGFFPPPNGVSIAGDLHFDIAEEWHCDPNLGGIDIGFVALHEIGHSIGLGHEMTDTAVMNPTYNPALVGGLAADDIIGAGEIYGGTPISDGFFFGNVGVGTDSPDGPIHVFKTDGTAQIVVEDTGTEPTLTMLHMKNNGRVQAVYENTDSGLTWQLSQHLTGFIISLVGTGGSEFRVLNDGGVQMGPGASITFDLDEAGNLTIGGNLTELSDRDQKENIVPVDPQELLERVAELPIAEWSRKGDESATRHVGPMAQDFYESFGLGTDERHLAAVDTSGIALGAIQGLHEQLLRKEAELLDQKKQIEVLRSELAEIKAMLSGSQ